METEISGVLAAETNWSDTIEVHEPQKVSSETEESLPSEPAIEGEQKEIEPAERPRKKPTGYLKKLGRAEVTIEHLTNSERALQARIAELEGKTSATPAKKQSDELLPPNPDDFENYYDLNRAEIEHAQKMAVKLAKDTVSETLATRDLEAQDRQFKAEIDAKAGSFDERLAKENPELLERINEAAEDGLITKPIALYIVNSQNSVEVAEYLTSNPDALEQLAKMNQNQLGMAFARIEGLVEGAGKTASQNRTTKASAPITSIKKTGSATRSYADMSLAELDKHWKK